MHLKRKFSHTRRQYIHSCIALESDICELEPFYKKLVGATNNQLSFNSIFITKRQRYMVPVYDKSF